MFDLDLVPSYTKTVSPEEFLSLSKEDKMDIESFKFIVPSIGTSEFGHFLLKLKIPTYSLPNG